MQHRCTKIFNFLNHILNARFTAGFFITLILFAFVMFKEMDFSQNIFKMRIKIIDGRLEEFFQKSFEEQLFSYFYKNRYREDRSLRLTETDKNIVLCDTSTTIQYSGNHFFPKSKENSVFIYNKSEKKVKRNTFGKREILEALEHFPQFDWLKEAHMQGNVSDLLFCNSIVRDVLLGKLTNAEAIVKKYLALNRIKGANWKTFAQYSSHLYKRYPIAWLQKHTTNINTAMEVLLVNYDHESTKEERERSGVFSDMFNEALALNKVINPSWSLNRMKEEHTDMTRTLMEMDFEQKEQVDIYDGHPQFDYPCKLLNTEREVFIEGYEMHHCIYSCYWYGIKEHKYLAFSFSEPERFTLGLNLTDNGWTYDQAHLKYNKTISEDSKLMIEQFLSDPNVKQTLEDLKDKEVVPELDTSWNYDNDDEWLRRMLGQA